MLVIWNIVEMDAKIITFKSILEIFFFYQAKKFADKQTKGIINIEHYEHVVNPFMLTTFLDSWNIK